MEESRSDLIEEFDTTLSLAERTTPLEVRIDDEATQTSESNQGVCISKLPPCVNRGKPSKKYVPEDRTRRETTYSITNYTSTKKIPQTL
jgi:hypothetical protein